MSVSQLRCACLDPAWRARWKAGDNPDVRDFASPGTATVYGSKFHALAQRLSAQLRKDRQSDREGHDALLARLYNLGGAAFLESLLRDGKIESAGAVTTAFHTFCDRLLQLREADVPARRFDQIFLSEEYALRDVILETSSGKLFVSGAIDSVRMSSTGTLIVVDYKLSTGERLDKELIQVALYRKLLLSSDPGLRVAGVLEYFLPELHITPLDENVLERAYTDAVVPVLSELVAARRESVRPAARLDRDRSKAVAAAAHVTAAPPAAADRELKLGATYGFSVQPVHLKVSTLARHSAVLGGTGSGKTTLVLRIVEQMLALSVPVLLLDRKGDLARYADPNATGEPALASLRAKLDIALFTPGHSGGRPLSFRLVPAVEGLSSEDQQAQFRSAAHALASMLKLKQSASDEAKRALLLRAIEFLARNGRAVIITGIVSLLESADPDFVESAGVLGKESAKLLLQLKSFEVMNQELLSETGEPLDTEFLLGLGRYHTGKTRLSIVSTRFFDSENTSLFWVAQLLSELNRYAARCPSPSLQALVVFDEADHYLPAIRQPVTKAPMESLLKRARSAGLGVMLATQSPGDLDYRCRENVLSWMIGRVKEPTALDKLKPLATAVGVDPETAFPKQKVGQFHLLTETSAKAFEADRSWLETEQLSEREILSLARNSAAPLK